MGTAEAEPPGHETEAAVLNPVTPGRIALDAARLLDAHSAGEVVIYDLQGLLSGMADYAVVATADSPGHLGLMANHLRKHFRFMGRPPLGQAGIPGAPWGLVDFGDCVVFMFVGPLRDYYDTDGLWPQARRVAWSQEDYQGKSTTC